jgi:hypothetical protein
VINPINKKNSEKHCRAKPMLIISKDNIKGEIDPRHENRIKRTPITSPVI